MRGEELVVHVSLHVRVVQHQTTLEGLPDGVLGEVVEAGVQVVNLAEHGLLGADASQLTRVAGYLTQPVQGGGLEDLLLPEVDEARALLRTTEARNDVRLGVRHVGSCDGSRASDDLPLDSGEWVRGLWNPAEHRQLLGSVEPFDHPTQDGRLEERDLGNLRHFFVLPGVEWSGV